eukprot:TRINITY_DN7583_c0_g1_i1.p1 TRINITY_DN7583_c0_g1~~TRINITY_DN7583_c0_g1_i1.p1  ORF type:complete len:832 (+),score=180.45 TRINITY_DN7583_c0_g1_i1:55-2550(+)
MAQELESFNNAKRTFTEFLEYDLGDGQYVAKLRDLVERKQNRLIVNMDDLRLFKPDFATEFMRYPTQFLPAFEDAVKDMVLSTIDPSAAKESPQFYVGVEGSFGAQHVSPRGLSARLLHRLVCIEGIVTKCSIVRPKVVKSVHYCQTTNTFHQREYRDATSLVGLPTSTVYPTKDDEGNLLTTEYGLCSYKDHQTISIQEMPERAPAGQLPRSVDVLLDNDIVDRCKPGDRIQVYGIYRALAGNASGSTNGVFRTVIIANNLRQLDKEVFKPVITEKDIANIREISNRRDVVELLSQSIAPSICGHEEVKRAVLFLLMGGVERNLANGTHLRGDVNLLMVGDPSTAKSQLLRFVLNLAPLAINTTGRGSSGVGLTAAVTTDSETGERRLEAGAMVLADRGVVCIDEFDKMSEADRVAIHEVMEQQTVTISKAGIHTSLNARCSVVAAANPVYGQYNRQKKATENIGLPDSLLSRFDLLFIILDTIDAETDRGISDHVLRMHRYRKPGQEGAFFNSEDIAHDESEPTDETPVFEPYNPLIHGSDKQKEVLSTGFLKKYIHYAKSRVKPTLTEKAAERISQDYALLRAKEDQRTLPITARTLETMIRLSSAHAKCRLSPAVTEEDVRVALRLMSFALYHEAMPTKTNKRGDANQQTPSKSTPKSPGAAGAESATVHDDEMLDDGENVLSGKKRKQSTGGEVPESDVFDFDEAAKEADASSLTTPRRPRLADDASMTEQSTLVSGLPQLSTPVRQAPATPQTPFGAARKKQFMRALNYYLVEIVKADSCLETEVDSAVNANNLDPFSPEEIEEILAEMERENRIHRSDGRIQRI